MGDAPVFFDPTGQRARRTRRALAVVLSVLGLVASIFVVSLVTLPLFTHSKSTPNGARRVPKMAESPANLWAATRASSAARAKLVRSIRPAAAVPLKPSEKIVAAYYAPWQEQGIHSLRANADRITHVMPAWLRLTPQGELESRDYDPTLTPHNADVVQIARDHGIRVTPILANSQEGEFEGDRVRGVLTDPARAEILIRQTRAWLLSQGFSGIHIDFENLSDQEQNLLPTFLKRCAEAFAADKLSVSAALEVSLDPAVMKACAASCDFVVVMAYDEHNSGTVPGPIASLSFVSNTIEVATREIPRNKIVMGIGAYGYDWGAAQSASPVTFDEVSQRVQDFRAGEPLTDVIEYDPSSMNPTFEYADDQGKVRRVWFLDGVTAYNQVSLCRQAQLRGAALWVLGAEDPSVWSSLDRQALTEPRGYRSLEKVIFPYMIDFEGEGEILSVKRDPQEGSRRVGYDPDTQLIDEAEYTALANPLVMQRIGQRSKQLVLTFDDGPDPQWTPRILDVLKELNVPAAFFMVGENVQRYGDLVRRIYDEGHELGNHSFTHPNLATVGNTRAELEINATQRAIEAQTFRSTRLFRPPYNADAEPTTPNEVAPIRIASSLGYVTVGELIDPQDWLTKRPGTDQKRTAEEMMQVLESDLNQHNGNVVLLHDAGGDRSETIRLLQMMVPKLRAEGYQFTTVANLAGWTSAQAMPPLSPRDLALAGVDRFAFTTWSAAEKFLAIAFTGAIFLGVLRQLFVIPLALAYHRRRKLNPNDASFRPSVSALVAAYNEEKVIVRTLESILASDYPLAEIIVVDDGSSDKTSEMVAARFAEDPRIVLIRQPNGGKAAALNHALSVAQGEILFCVDADTQLDSRAVGLLVAHFSDPNVGAVAGNVRVGNPINVLTQWQSVEYTTSQNLDRRAFAQLNAVTVVPGAIGAWRASAVRDAGGYLTDTLAEDMDLTWRIRQAGHRIETESDALAFTEAPESFGAFFKQRFRWAYGTLQCLWKHRRALGRHGWFGRVALPLQWLFQIVFQALAPLMDLKLISAAGAALYCLLVRGSRETDAAMAATDTLVKIAFFYGLFFVIELIAGVIAYRLEKTSARPLIWLGLQRFVYRQIMYGVIYKSLTRAIVGARQGWGKLDRTARVQMP